jgi:catechol 2,3-dioxygenase-like lactoylglutathione lyase family enzyme
MPDWSLPDTSIFQICVIVDDLERYAENYREILGYNVPHDHQVTHAHDHTQATYYGKPMDARAKITSWMMGGVAFELLQPLDEGSIWADFLRERGPALHHIAFNVPRTAPAAAYFADRGYSVIQQGLFTGRSGMYAYLDSEKDLGVTIELLEHYQGGSHQTAAAFPRERGIGTDRVVQVGLVVEDIAATAQHYRRVLDLPEPNWQQTPGREITETTYHGEPSDATARLAFFDLGQTQLELIQPDQHPSVWRKDLNARGDHAHHIAFKVESTAQAIEHFARHGIIVGQQGYYGDRSGMYTYLDSQASLGVTIELLENFGSPR